MGVFTRGSKLWIRFRDADGAWRNVASGYGVGEEKLATAMYDVVIQRVADAVARNRGEVMSARRGERILGPYEERAGWRVVTVDVNGKRCADVFETKARAMRFIDLLRAELAKVDPVNDEVETPPPAPVGATWGYVYFLRENVADGARVKIGKARDIAARKRELDTRPTPLMLAGYIRSDDPFDLEGDLHRRFSTWRINGFRSREWFWLSDEIAAFIREARP